MVLAPYERETCVGWHNDTNMAELTTFNRALINKMDKMCKKYPEVYKMVREIVLDGKVAGKEYVFNKDLITFRAPTKKTMTPEQAVAVRERMAKARKARGKKQ